jgi:transcription termination/antitermination protein NusG
VHPTDPDPSLSSGKNWFAVFTAPRHEKRVDQHFKLRDIESFLPLYQTPCRWKDGSKKLLQLPLFPRYIFAHIEVAGRIQVLRVPGVLAIVGGKRIFLPIPDSYIHFLREGLRQGKIEPHQHLTEGTKVRIRSGVMAGTEGVLLRRKRDFRVVLTLDMIMLSMTVEVGIDEIEPVLPVAEMNRPGTDAIGSPNASMKIERLSPKTMEPNRIAS